jgi:cytochrome c oxidase subunit I+III
VRRLVEGLARWPLTWRAALVTSTLDATPKEVFRVAGPSIWPFVSSVGLITIFASEIWQFHTMTLIGAAILVGGMIGWHWPTRVDTTVEEELAFEEEHGVDVRSAGSRTVVRSGTALLILILAIALGSLLFSYFYIRLENPVWPPENIPHPGLLLPAISTALLVASGAAVYWARRGIRAGKQGQLKAGLLLAFLLGLAAAAVQVYDYTLLPYGWGFNAYASLFYLIGGFLIAILAGALVMNLLIQYWALRGEYSARHHLAVEVAWTIWPALIAGWVIGFGILYLIPYLT